MSKFVTLHGFGGSSSGTELNFEIVGGTTQPMNPKENTIWVNTDVEITGYYFSATKPEHMVEGEVWFGCDLDSAASFNALKENNITIYPVNAKQCISGELVTVIAESYTGEIWTTLLEDYYLLSSATGFDASIVTTYSANASTNTSLSTSNNQIALSGWYNGIGGHRDATFDKSYDLTNYNTIEFNVISVAGTSGTGSAFIDTSRTYVRGGNHTADIWLCQTGRRILDISSLVGEYYIHLYVEGYPEKVGYTIDEIVLKA